MFLLIKKSYNYRSSKLEATSPNSAQIGPKNLWPKFGPHRIHFRPQKQPQLCQNQIVL